MQLSIIRHGSSDSDEVITLGIVGSIDLVTRQVLVDAVADAMTAARSVVLDAGAVDFVDSTGVGALVEISQMAQRQGVEVTMTRQSPRLQRVLSLVGLDRAWSPHERVGVGSA